MRDHWTIQTERMSVTLVSEPAPMAKRIGGPPLPPGFEPPVLPAYLIITPPGGGQPIRIEGEDAELLMWMLVKLGRPGRQFGMVPSAGEFMGSP